MKPRLLKTYKGFGYSCEDEKSEERLKEYIDSLGEEPTELKSVSDENYEAWRCDYDFDGVKLLVLPTSIKKIGKCVFAQSKIENLIADGVLEIDELAFYNTQNLVSVRAKACKKLVSTDPETGAYTDGSDAFNHSAASSLELPSLEYAGRYAFYDMPNIERLELPNVIMLEPHAIYGCESLKVVSLSMLRRAGYSIITRNENLERVELASLLERDRLAIHSNGDCRVIAPAGRLKSEPSFDDEALEYGEDVLKEARRKEVFNYDFNYKGFCYTLVDGLSDDEQRAARRNLESLIDEWESAGEITDSPNAGSNESGHEALTFVKDIYISPRIRRVGDYAFSKCYGLESVVAPSVLEVGDHAFYCDGGVRYVELENCKLLRNDAFNGTGIDSISNGFGSKFFAPKVATVGSHAFWQTGFRVVELPSCEKIKRTALEENPYLQRVVLKRLKDWIVINKNPNLREVCAESIELKEGLYGCPLAKENIATSEPGGDE